jgi:hypothetical protein
MTKSSIIPTTVPFNQANIRTGDLLFCSGKWLTARAIQLFTWSKINHVGVACHLQINGYKKLCMFEAMESRDVRIMNLEQSLNTLYWPKGGQVIWCPLQDTIDRDRVIQFCLDHWGQQYASWYQFLLFMSPRLRWARKLLGLSLDTNINRWHCSEIVTRALVEAGYKFNAEPALTTPGQVYNFNCYRDKLILIK